MECRLLITMGVSIPRSDFAARIRHQFEEIKDLPDQFNAWYHKALIRGEKDLIKQYTKMLEIPRFHADHFQKDFRQSIVQSKIMFKKLSAMETPPDAIKPMLEREFTNDSDLLTLKKFFILLLKLKTKGQGFGLDLSSDGEVVYVTHEDLSHGYAKDAPMYRHELPTEYFTKSNFTHAKKFCELVGLPIPDSGPFVIVDHYDGRRYS